MPRGEQMNYGKARLAVIAIARVTDEPSTTFEREPGKWCVIVKEPFSSGFMSLDDREQVELFCLAHPKEVRK